MDFNLLKKACRIADALVKNQDDSGEIFRSDDKERRDKFFDDNEASFGFSSKSGRIPADT